MSAMFIRIWNADDGGKSFIHLMSGGMDSTICGHDAVCGPHSGTVAHFKDPVELTGRHRVTCGQCLSTIRDVEEYLRLWKSPRPPQ